MLQPDDGEGGKNFRARTVTCLASCGFQGHYMGAELCKENHKHSKRSRRVDFESSSSESEKETSESESSQPDSGTDYEHESEKKGRGDRVGRVFARLSMIRRIGGKRYPNIRRTKSRYTVSVIIKERKVSVY